MSNTYIRPSGTTDKNSDTAYTPLRYPYTIETITLEAALEILEYPKIIGVHKRKNVEIKDP